MEIKECFASQVKHFPLWHKGNRGAVARFSFCCKAFRRMNILEPGSYDGVVVDADELDDDALSIEIALSTGPRKGDIVRVRGPRAGRDSISILGLPVTLVVTEEGVRVRIEGG